MILILSLMDVIICEIKRTSFRELKHLFILFQNPLKLASVDLKEETLFLHAFLKEGENIVMEKKDGIGFIFGPLCLF